ncbi:MAG: hypothetical protein SH859_07685 [Hyphomicrobium aestuarii]|nr:hypothetical protein [Hyphomicrobium aestuarii]
MIATISNLGRIAALFGASLIAAQVWPAGGVAAAAAGLLPVVLIGLAARPTLTLHHLVVTCAAGLVVDCVSGGPLGQWALVYALAAALAPRLAGSGSVSRKACGLAGLVAMAAAVNAVIVVAFSIGHLGSMTSELHVVARDAGLAAWDAIRLAGLGAATILFTLTLITITGGVLAAIFATSVRLLRALVKGPVKDPVIGRSDGGAPTWR